MSIYVGIGELPMSMASFIQASLNKIYRENILMFNSLIYLNKY